MQLRQEHCIHIHIMILSTYMHRYMYMYIYMYVLNMRNLKIHNNNIIPLHVANLYFIEEVKASLHITCTCTYDDIINNSWLLVPLALLKYASME